MEPNEKLDYFEYILKKLLEWYLSLKSDEATNDFSITVVR